MNWQVLLKERFSSKDGRSEELCILKGPTYPCEFYAGPVLSRYTTTPPYTETMPRFNATGFYHRTEEDALEALIEMKEDLQK